MIKSHLLIIKYLVENTDKVLLNETTNRLNGRNSTGTNCTGKSLSEALIFAATNPQYDNRLFIELQEHAQNMLCTQIVFVLDLTFKQFMYTSCSEVATFIY